MCILCCKIYMILYGMIDMLIWYNLYIKLEMKFTCSK